MFRLLVRDDVTLASYSSQPELQIECTHSGNILALFLKAQDDMLLLGDLVRSITLLQYSPGTLRLTSSLNLINFIILVLLK